jgi:hypothetical protein
MGRARANTLLHLIAIKERLPELIIVSAHDMCAFAKMPSLSASRREFVRSVETAE